MVDRRYSNAPHPPNSYQRGWQLFHPLPPNKKSLSMDLTYTRKIEVKRESGINIRDKIKEKKDKTVERDFFIT
jgi:hypothetical protein